MKTILIASSLLCLLCSDAAAAEDSTIVFGSDTVAFGYTIPQDYDPLNPPAILVWWHGLGGNELEYANSTAFEEQASAHGWISASHYGPNDRHWNTRIPQRHCRIMLDWIMERYPFSTDSIYMAGGSMGGAGGLIWHQNNCVSDDPYFIAATAGGSPIMDTQRRQEQYLFIPDTNRSMRAAFGGLPSEGDSVAYEYHRYSAIFLADTTRCMHWNSLHLPTYLTWGTSVLEDTAYGRPIMTWDSLRHANADSIFLDSAHVNGHGFQVMWAEGICDWLSGFSANRYPDQISISADEDDCYYWTCCELAGEPYDFGRYDATVDSSSRSLSVTLLRNIHMIRVRMIFPWPSLDSLHCICRNFDHLITQAAFQLAHVPNADSVVSHSGEQVPFTYSTINGVGVLEVQVRDSAEFTVYFTATTTQSPPALPRVVSLTAYPNPFNLQINFEVSVSHPANDKLVLYDLTGREALTYPLSLRAGENRVSVSAAGLASGIYFARISGMPAKPLKVVLLK